MGDRTIVALGCSPDADYSFLLPLTALLWRRIGFEPLAIIVGRNRGADGLKNGGALEWAIDKQAKLALDALRLHRIPTYSVAAVDGYPYATTAQVVRQHVAALMEIADFDRAPQVSLTIREDDWIIPGDSDLWPLWKKYYRYHENSSHRCVSYYWNGDNFVGKTAFLKAINEGRRSQTLPTCHIAMRAQQWREIYGLAVGENLADAVERTLTQWYERYPRDGFNTWMSDQDIMTARVCQQPWFPTGRPPDDGLAHESGEVLFVGRKGQPPLDRLDRSHLSDWNFDNENWLDASHTGRWKDAHVFRASHTDENWQKLRPIVAALLPDHVQWVDEYQRAFLEAGK